MLSYEQMMRLTALPNKESVISEVSKLSEEDAKQALIMALLSWRKGHEINEQIAHDHRARIAELEKQLGI